MGRTDAVAFTLECVKAWRALGAEVTLEPGFETRGNGQQADYTGGILHHTASPSSATNPFPSRKVLLGGRPDLSGPLCNVAGPWCPPERPRLHVIAANPANHAGASGGKSMGPLPVTRTFNKTVFGLEIDYAGSSPMAPGQARAMLIFTAGLTQVLGRLSCEWVRGHAETSITGKWDPGYATGKTVDLAAVRRDALALTMSAQQQEEPMTPEDRAYLDKRFSDLWALWNVRKDDQGVWRDRLTDLWDRIGAIQAEVATLHPTGGPAALSDADVQRIAAAVIGLLGRKTSTP